MSSTKTPVELAIERAMARIGCPPGDNSDADLYHELSAALSSLKSVEPRLTVDDAMRVANEWSDYEPHVGRYSATKQADLRRRLTQSAKP